MVNRLGRRSRERRRTTNSTRGEPGSATDARTAPMPRVYRCDTRSALAGSLPSCSNSDRTGRRALPQRGKPAPSIRPRYLDSRHDAMRQDAPEDGSRDQTGARRRRGEPSEWTVLPQDL